VDTTWLHREFSGVGWHRYDDWLDDMLSANRAG
jgi:hypothetical protein